MELSPLVSPVSGVSQVANVAGLVRGVGARTLSTKLNCGTPCAPLLRTLDKQELVAYRETDSY